MATFGQFKSFGPFLSASGDLYLLRIYHYITGTTTLLNMWTTRNKASTVAQPLESDSAGIASAFGDGIYKFRIDGSTDGVSYSTIYTLDEVAVGDQGSSLSGEGAAISSASTLTLGTDGDFFHVTGSTGPITAISGSQARVTLVFDATPTLTHSGNLVLQEAANYTVAANIVMTFVNDGSGVWRETSRTALASTFTLLDAAGDVIYGTSDNVGARLAIGTARQMLQVNPGATAPIWANPLTMATAQASTSGTAIDFTGIPAGVRRITIMFVGVSTNGTSPIQVLLGDAGGVEASGYLTTYTEISGASVVGTVRITTGFSIAAPGGTNAIFHGTAVLDLENAATFTWTCRASLGQSDADENWMTNGSKSTSQELDRVRITTAGGANTFDAGSINIAYE